MRVLSGGKPLTQSHLLVVSSKFNLGIRTKVQLQNCIRTDKKFGSSIASEGQGTDGISTALTDWHRIPGDSFTWLRSGDIFQLSLGQSLQG